MLIEADFITAARSCEQCGTTMPYGHPRMRADDGRLLCNGCHPDGAGPGEGRPVGHHGKVADLNDGMPGMGFIRWVQETYHKINQGESGDMIPSWFPTGLLTPQEIATSRFASHKIAAEWAENPNDKSGGLVWGDADTDDWLLLTQPAHSDGSWTYHGIIEGDRVNGGRHPSKEIAKADADEMIALYKKTSRKVAHDSGDGERVFHCPMCGSGKVVGRSDGTIECGFCQQHFTVQIQPQHPGVPQTIDGQPYEWPGQPEGSFDPTDQTAMDPTQEIPPGGPPKDLGDQQPSEEDEPKGKVPPQFAKGSRYLVTEAGVALPEDSYLRHLAIRYADDPQRVIAEVRSTR